VHKFKLKPSATADGSDLNAELKTIIAKATHEDTTRRYASVEQFSEDIRRFQNNLPILAQGDGFAYRSRKFVKRHRFSAFAAALVLLTLLGGMSATFWQFRRAQNERKLAEQRFNDVRSLANSVIFDLHDEIQSLPGSTKARKLLVEKALEYLNKLEQDAGNDAGLQHELAMAYSKIGDVQGQFFEASLLETDKAAVNYRKALELAEKSVAGEPDNFEFRRDLALICHRFAQFQRGGSDLTETLQLENHSVEIFEKLVAEKPSDAEVRRLWLISRRGYSDVLREAGELEKSLPLYEQNLAFMLAALRDFPDDIKLRRFSAGVYGNYALALFLHDEQEKAFENQMIAKDIAEKMNAFLKDDISAVRGIGAACEDATKYASAIGNNALAESNAVQGIGIMEKISKDDAENLEAKYDVASLHNTYADFLEKNNRWQEAFENRQKSLDAIAPLEKNADNPDYYTAEFFSFYSKFALTAAKLGKKDLAEKYIQKAESLIFQIEKTTAEVQNLYPVNFVALGDAYTILGDKDKAKSYYQKAVETWQNLQTNGKLYPNQTKNFAAANEKLKQ
jgi:eukaryotic-like serine/threonine-protein kinase